MCVTNIYVDVYPDGRRQEFRQTSICQYGNPGRPCAKLSTLSNPVRKIKWGEPTTEYMLTQGLRAFPQTPHTPPRSSGGSHHHRSGGSNHRRSGYASSSEEGRRRKHSKHRDSGKTQRIHRKERIVIVDAPPTPRTPPQAFNQTFTAPNSPAQRGRPIIVDERIRRQQVRLPSVDAVVSGRPPRRSRSTSRPRYGWDTPSNSHTSFDLRARLEAEERNQREMEDRRRRYDERDERIAQLEAEKRRRDFIAAQDEEIRSRPAVPFPLRQRAYLRPMPVIDQTQALMGSLSLNDRPVIIDRPPVVERPTVVIDPQARLRMQDRERLIKRRVEAQEEEELQQRLRERQLPRRRFSVGPAQRRTRVLYDDGVYRWE